MEQEENNVLIFQKNADKKSNRIIIPKFFIEKFGRTFYMKIYENEIRIIPVKKKEGE